MPDNKKYNKVVSYYTRINDTNLHVFVASIMHKQINSLPIQTRKKKIKLQYKQKNQQKKRKQQTTCFHADTEISAFRIGGVKEKQKPFFRIKSLSLSPSHEAKK